MVLPPVPKIPTHVIFSDTNKKIILNDVSSHRSNHFSSYSSQSKSDLEEVTKVDSIPCSKIEHEIKIQTNPTIFSSESTPNFYLNNKKISSSSSYITKNSPISTPTHHLKDSAYNTNSSNEDAEFEKEIKIRSAFTIPNQRENHAVSDKHEEHRQEKPFQTNGSVINRLKIQHEEVAQQKKNKVITSDFNHKIVGGVKVFPSLPHSSRQAALEARQNRLNAIEASLAELETRSKKTELKNSIQKTVTTSTETEFESSSKYQNEYNQSLNFEDVSSETEHEIIDLTRRKEQTNAKCSSSSFFSEQKAISTHEDASLNVISRDIDIPIQFLSTTPLKDQKLPHDKNVHFQQLSTNSSNNVKRAEEFFNIDNKELKETSNLDQKVNYIYYYDNEQFGGY